jgi:hypothetical protein
MNLSRRLIGALFLASIAGVIGFYFGQRFSSQPPSANDIQPLADRVPKLKTSEQMPTPTTPIVSAPAGAAEKWADRCVALQASPGTPARDEELLAAIEVLAAHDSMRAIALAMAEPRLRVRKDFLRATLRGWARTAPDAAAEWAVASQTLLDKTDAVSSVFAGLSRDPEALLRLYSRLTEKMPELTGMFGLGVINTLTRNGNFAHAAEFAATAVQENQLDWITLAYSSWADYQPEAALAAARAIADPNRRNSALDAITSTWANNDPKAVAEFAATLPRGHQRELAFSTALRDWAVNDPVAVANWINQAEPSSELDAGIASIATAPQMRQNPALAVSWAETITARALRSATVAEIVHQWFETDPVAARQYAQTTRAIQIEDRDLLLAELEKQPKSGP